MNCLQYYYDPLLLPTIPSNHTSLAWISLSLLLHGGYSWGVDLVRTYQQLGLLVITVDICKVLQHCNHCVVIFALEEHLSAPLAVREPLFGDNAAQFHYFSGAVLIVL